MHRFFRAAVVLTLFMVPVVYSAYKEFKMNLGLKDRHWEAGGL